MAPRPRDIADRLAQRKTRDDGFRRETFTLPRDAARLKARDFLSRYPKAGYMSAGGKLARAARRRHRVHDAPAAQRGLTHPGRCVVGS